MSLEKEFVPYELALRMKQLGFDEPCIGYYDGNHNFQYMFNGYPENFSYRKFPLGHSVGWTSAPTFSQAFRWFREKYGMIFTLVGSVYYYPSVSFTNTDGNSEIELGEFESYEEAELACLDKLIEIIETKSE